MNALSVHPGPAGQSAALEDAYRRDPGAFHAFVQGVTAAAIQSVKGPDALPEPSSTLDKVIEVYRRSATIKARTVQNNILALLRLIEVATGKRDSAQIPLSEINKNLLFQAQEAFVRLATAGMKEGPEKKIAIEQALRTSRSYIRQARSIFAGCGIDFLSRYAAEGIAVAQCVGGFLNGKLRGKPRKVYKTAPPDAITRAIEKIDAKRLSDLPVYFGFWLALGGGLRRGEIRQCRWEHLFANDDGTVWVRGDDLIGKDGLPINIRLQKRAADALRPFVRAMRSEGFQKVVDGQFDKRLNAFLREMGFNTRLGIHELRAVLGSRLYEVNPRAAKEQLRHKNLQTTEDNYGRYVQAAETPEVI